MPRIASAKKRMRQTTARTARNKAQRSQLRTAIKRARIEGLTPAEVALIDRAGQKQLIHPNAAARLKSRLATRST